jgi:multiple sugar transport system substrate-binding protein
MMKRKAIVALIAAAGLAVSLAACSSSGSGSGSNAKASSCSNTITYPKATRVTVWGWYTAEKAVSNLFNTTHKDVQICWTKAGTGNDEYTKLRTALAAGSGAPDVVMLEYDQVNSFTIKKNLVDLQPYGAAKHKDSFAPGFWDSVSAGSSVYAVPVDAGPVGLFYRKDLFAKAGITTPPTTWAEYAADAAQYAKSGAPGSFGNYGANGQQILLALNEQAGSKAFSYNPGDPTKIGIDFNNADTKKVVNYWVDLVKNKQVTSNDLFATDNATALAKGLQATYVGAAWGQGYISGLTGQNGKGQWAAAPLPQWDASSPISVNWGGSSFAVTSQAADKKAAAEVALGMYATEKAVNLDIAAGDVFPTQTAILNSTTFQDTQPAFYNGQKIFKDVFIPAGNAYKGETYSPFAPYLYAQLQTALTSAFKGTSSADAALDSLQGQLVAYAKQQGFKVSTTVN